MRYENVHGGNEKRLGYGRIEHTVWLQGIIKKSQCEVRYSNAIEYLTVDVIVMVKPTIVRVKVKSNIRKKTAIEKQRL